MVINPLFAKDPDEDHHEPKKDSGYLLKHRRPRTIQPLSKPPYATTDNKPVSGSTSAVELIRQKVAAVYSKEPDVREELVESAQQPAHRPSKHQQFMHQLSTSGKSLAHIQTEWHNYYVQLPSEEKHEVWREFYEHNSRRSAYAPLAQNARPSTEQFATPHITASQAVVSEHAAALPTKPATNKRAVAHIKKRIINRVLASSEAQTKAKQHLHSLVFGLASGFVVLAILLFGFFNEMIIAPFIQPSRHVSATPIIVNSDSVAAGAMPEVIIPKINVQIPTVYDKTSIDEASIQRSLEQGVIHYPTTVQPGEQGNTAFFGHSSNNLFNKGKYKFAFVLLHELVPGDIFYLTYDSKIYTYRVFDKKVVAPSEVSVLSPVAGKLATATLITCDPPGTSTNRLVVWGEQISPDPAGAAAPATPAVDSSVVTELPSEGPTLWVRFWDWLF